MWFESIKTRLKQVVKWRGMKRKRQRSQIILTLGIEESTEMECSEL